MKRVLIFSTAYFPFIGGAEVAVKEITDRISEVEFVMLTARLDKKLPAVEKVGNIEVHRLGKGNNWDKYRLIWLGARYAQNLGHFDAIWGIMASYAGFSALRYKKRENRPCLPAGRPFLLALQEGDSKWDIYKHVWWCWPYFKQIFMRADMIQAISNYLAEWAKKMGAKCPIDVVPNGVEVNIDESQLNQEDLAQVKNQGVRKGEIYSVRLSDKNIEEIQNINKKDNLKEKDILILTVSRLVKKNGLEDLIRAMKYLPENYKLRIIGTGELEETLKKVVQNLGLTSRIKFHGNFDNNQIWKQYSQFDNNWKYHQHGLKVFVRPSLSEGLGNALLEAMHLQTPVIATPVGGIPDFLKDGETGWFCKVKNPKSIAEKIKYVTDEKNKEEIWRVTGNAVKLVREKYNWDLIANKMRNIFLSL